ncbi:MAG TPA: hypothetical protein VII73_06725 [Caulobacteraceae bacterium]
MKLIIAAALGASLLAGAGLASAQDYRGGDRPGYDHRSDGGYRDHAMRHDWHRHGWGHRRVCHWRYHRRVCSWR